jgi:hypothetical protein
VEVAARAAAAAGGAERVARVVEDIRENVRGVCVIISQSHVARRM